MIAMLLTSVLLLSPHALDGRINAVGRDVEVAPRVGALVIVLRLATEHDLTVGISHTVAVFVRDRGFGLEAHGHGCVQVVFLDLVPRPNFLRDGDVVLATSSTSTEVVEVPRLAVRVVVE